MKNLFKSMMLVAVAAMAFTACQKDNGELNTLTKKTIINGVATIENDNTRSGFVGTETIENEDGSTTTYYKSAWDGGENIKLFINYGAAEATATVDAEGKFTVELDGDYSESCTITACSPAEAWSSEYSFTIPAEQTPRTESVDPAAHILKAQTIPVTNGAANFKMQHEVSYGKMTVNTPEDFKIAKVVINLKGTWYGTDKDLTYTLNATNVENNTFWFATDTIEVSEMTVTAYDAEDNAYTKTVTMDENKVLKFQYYKVSTFSVSNLEEYVAPKFTSAYTSSITSSNIHDFYMYFEDSSNNLKKLQLNPYYVANSDLTFTPGTYYIKSSSYNFYGEKYSTYGDTYLYGGTIKISVVDKEYHFEFIDLIDGSGNVVLAYATYTGTVVGLNVPDYRTALVTPVPTAEKTGDLTATISWEDINGAVGYKVACNCGIDITTTDTSIELTFPEYGTHYVFVTALAADDDKNYKNSETATATLTLKDPNILADYIMDTIVWDSSGERFKLTNAAEYPSYVYLRFNEADRPGNNSIKVGEYFGAGHSDGTTPVPVGQFTARVGWDMWTIVAWSTFTASTTVNVSYADNAYTIILTDATGKTFGYKGMPEGWVAPVEGGDDNTGEGGDDNTGEGGDDNTGGNEPTQSFENWVFSAELDMDTRIVTATDDTHIVTFTLNTMSGGTFVIGDTSGALHITNITVNGVAAESASGTLKMDSSTGYKIVLDAIINGVKYTGTSTNNVA